MSIIRRDVRHDAGRRRFFQLLLAAPFALVAGLRWNETLEAATAPARTRKPSITKPGAAGGSFEPTPECEDDDEPTPEQTAGPFYKIRSPRRASLLEPGLAGTPMVLAGRVFSRECRPVAGALVDFWHADDAGAYDNEGFKLRGHQFTDAAGRYRLATIVPGLYPGRTRHFHVRVQAPEGRVLTTQIYFPDETENHGDGLFRPELLMTWRDPRPGAKTSATKIGRFHFMI